MTRDFVMENGADSSVSKATLHKNAAAWDRLAKAHDALASPACDKAFIDPRNWLGTGGPADLGEEHSVARCRGMIRRPLSQNLVRYMTVGVMRNMCKKVVIPHGTVAQVSELKRLRVMHGIAVYKEEKRIQHVVPQCGYGVDSF